MALHLPKPRSNQTRATEDRRAWTASTYLSRPQRPVVSKNRNQSNPWGIGRTHQQSLRPPRSVPKSAKKAYGKQLSTPEVKPPSDRTRCAAGRSKDESHTPTSPNVRTAASSHRTPRRNRMLSQRKSAVHDQRSLATAPGKPTNYVRTRKRNSKTSKPDDIMDRAGVLRPGRTTQKKPTIRVRGGVSVRNGSEEGYDYRVRTLDFANSDSPVQSQTKHENSPWRWPTTIMPGWWHILERHATMDYPENKGFDQYSNDFGFHFDSIESVHIDWS